MMKCAVYDHPLVDGVIVEDMAVVRFIRKIFWDFRMLEKVCRKCRDGIQKIYREKLKRAIALKKAQLRDSSIQTKSSSSSSSSVSHHLNISQDSIDLIVNQTPNHVKAKRSKTIGSSTNINAYGTLYNTVSIIDTPSTISTSLSNKLPILQENNQTNSTRIVVSITEEENATVNGNFSTNPRLSQEPTTSKGATTSEVSNGISRKRTIPDYLKAINSKTTNDKRDLERPTTSKGAAAVAASGKRHISEVNDVDNIEDDDEPRYSLNAFNNTRSPNIQPLPPKQKPRTDISRSQLAMIEYAKDITGG